MLTAGVAQLAAATSDGGVYVLPVTRKADAENGRWDLTVGSFATIMQSDKRAVNALKWVTVGACKARLTAGRHAGLDQAGHRVDLCRVPERAKDNTPRARRQLGGLQRARPGHG